jgi:hypothetical protein
MKVFLYDVCFVQILSMTVLFASVPQNPNLKIAELWPATLCNWKQSTNLVTLVMKKVKKHCPHFSM